MNMTKEEVLENYLDYLSPDLSKRKEALIQKSKWFKSTFYIPFSFKGEYNLPSLTSFLDGKIKFSKLRISNIETTSSKNSIDIFNKFYRYVKLYSSIPKKAPEDVFFIQINLSKIDKTDYKLLMPAFFYCLPASMMKFNYLSTDIRQVFKRACTGSLNEAVLILDKNFLEENDSYEVDGIDFVIIYDQMSEKKQEIIEKVAKKFKLRVKYIYS